MKKAIAIKKFQEKYDLNHILSSSIISQLAKKDFSDSDLENIFNKYKESKARPFIKWVGGKRQLLQQFKEMGLYPPTGFNPIKNTYFEPFVGGGAVFLDLLPKKSVLSDMNLELVATYNVIKKDYKKLISKLKFHQKNNSKEYFLKVRAQNLKRLSSVSVAARFIYLNRTCFNGMYRVNKSGGFNVPYGKYDNPKIVDIENLKNISEQLQNVKILHQDYKKTIQNAKKGDFIYFDPPYAPLNPTSSFTAYTKDGFGEQQQIKFMENLKKKIQK